MKQTIKVLCVILCCLSLLSLCGCGMLLVDMDDTKENKAYQDTITALFDALDNKNADAVYNLFSPAAREEDQDLKDQITKLMSVYEGPTDEILWNELLNVETSSEHGKRSRCARATFPVRSGDAYFWCYMSLMYVNTFDESQVGVVQLDFYTADEMSIFIADDGVGIEDSVGLTIHAERTVEGGTRCISGWPYAYSTSTDALNIDDAISFLETSNCIADFKEHFGEPNAEDIYTYYELPSENGEPRYLQIGVDYDGTIYGATVVDERGYIETVFDAEQ